MKICIKCNIEKNFKEFSIRKDSKDGFRTECKECKSSYLKNYCKINKEKLSENYRIRSKVYYENNKEKSSERGKVYRENNKEKESLRHKKDYQENKESIMLRRKEYRKSI